jgi:hypothetical protein
LPQPPRAAHLRGLSSETVNKLIEKQEAKEISRELEAKTASPTSTMTTSKKQSWIRKRAILDPVDKGVLKAKRKELLEKLAVKGNLFKLNFYPRLYVRTTRV